MEAVPLLAAAVAEIPAVREEPEAEKRRQAETSRTHLNDSIILEILDTFILVLYVWLTVAAAECTHDLRLQHRLGQDLAPHVVAGEVARKLKTEAQRLGSQAAATAEEAARCGC